MISVIEQTSIFGTEYSIVFTDWNKKKVSLSANPANKKQVYRSYVMRETIAALKKLVKARYNNLQYSVKYNEDKTKSYQFTTNLEQVDRAVKFLQVINTNSYYEFCIRITEKIIPGLQSVSYSKLSRFYTGYQSVINGLSDFFENEISRFEM